LIIEALVTLLPPEAGGRRIPIAPREGSYRPYARLRDARIRLRFIEGPPAIAPGETARVVLELENAGAMVRAGDEIELLELSEQSVGLATISRVWLDS
jgi:hypothetical protein